MLFLRSIFWNRKKEIPLKSSPSHSIAEAFKEYINNEIPARLIDTSRLRFVSRRDIFRVFQDEIANVTEEQVQERIRSLRDPLATYQPRRETILRQIIQETVKYVVLSHRWDEIAGEASYQDISSGKRRIDRFKKLSQFCKTARKLGCKLAWADTCCIDKTNAAELSEAIHAMYKWYANSYRCIVYLAGSTSSSDWVNEPWFTRGWTLQELLAPKRLKFYDKDWRPFTPLGTDDDRQFIDIISPLESVTGISREVFTADNSQGVEGHTFWEIMSWASKRQTTRIEDRAYSLVGLLRVNLTIAYGEGHRAFARLVEAIAAKSPSWDVFAWSGQPSMDHFALPLSPASYGRFETHMAEGRVGVKEFTISPYGLSLKSLPPIPMEVCSVVDPEGPGNPFLVNLKPREEESSLGRYGNLVVECGATRLRTIRSARRLSACVLNYHGGRNRNEGKLVVGTDYVCFLLYSEDGRDDETSWMKLNTDNFLLLSCVGLPVSTSTDSVTRRTDFKDTQKVGIPVPKSFSLSLVTTFIRSHPST